MSSFSDPATNPELRKLLEQFDREHAEIPPGMARDFEQMQLGEPEVEVQEGFTGKESVEQLLMRLIDAVEELPTRIVSELLNAS